MSPNSQVLEASNWPYLQEIKLQHLINSPAMHGVKLYTGLIKKYGPEQVIKGGCFRNKFTATVIKAELLSFPNALLVCCRFCPIVHGLGCSQASS